MQWVLFDIVMQGLSCSRLGRVLKKNMTSPISIITVSSINIRGINYVWDRGSSSTSSFEFLTQSFLHRAKLKIRGSERSTRSSLIAVVHVVSWPPACLHHDGVGKQIFLISSPRALHTRYKIQRSFVQRGIKNVGREPSWGRPNTENH